MDESRRLSDGSLLAFEKIYPLDAVFDTLDDMPEERARATSATRTSATARSTGWRSALVADFGEQAARHRRALARQRPRGEEAAARDEPRRLPRRGERERVLARVAWSRDSAR